MKIAAHVLAYNVNRFLRSVLENIEPHVDKIYIAYSEKPWGYVKESRENLINPTTLEFILQASSSSKIEVIEGDWLTEEDMRNACLDKASIEGFDWLLIQDADEFYTESSWDQIKTNLAQYDAEVDHVITTWYNFWKTSQYVLTHQNGSIKGTNAGFAVRCGSDVRFVKKRLCNAKNSLVMDCPCYHYGYVMSDMEMKEKLVTWGHSKQVNINEWFKYKWQNWTEETLHIHPTNPAHWLRAIRFPMEQPPFAEQFSLPISLNKSLSLKNILGDTLYNLQVRINGIKKIMKKIIKVAAQ